MDDIKKKEDVSRANRELSLLYPDVRTRFFRLQETMKNHYKPIFLVEGYRSFARQEYLYEKKIKVTSATAGSSFHNYGLAIDVAFLDANPYGDYHPWLDLRRIAVACGFEPISKFSNTGELIGDRPHFQCRYGLTLKEIRELYAFNGFVAIWTKLDQIRGVPVGDNWR